MQPYRDPHAGKEIAGECPTKRWGSVKPCVYSVKQRDVPAVGMVSDPPFRTVRLVAILAVEGQGAEALRSGLDNLQGVPWYDPSTDELLPVELQRSGLDAEHRDSRWQSTANTNAPGSGSSGTSNELIGWLLLILVVLSVVWIGYRMWRVRQTERDAAAEQRRRLLRDSEALKTVIEQLPLEPVESRGDLQVLARQLADQGQWDRATAYLFAHALVACSARGQLDLARGKTNHQYLRELRSSSPDEIRFLFDLVQLFERSFFGGRQVQRDEFEGLWRRRTVLIDESSATMVPALAGEV
jgi:hypothetical protein